MITSYHDPDFPELDHRALELEYHDDDVLKLTAAARSPQPVVTLMELTGGDPGRSRVFREYLEPCGIEHAVWIALRSRTSETWGSMDLWRERGRPAFSVDELRFLRAASPLLADGARRGLLVGEATDPEGPERGGPWPRVAATAEGRAAGEMLRRGPVSR